MGTVYDFASYCHGELATEMVRKSKFYKVAKRGEVFFYVVYNCKCVCFEVEFAVKSDAKYAEQVSGFNANFRRFFGEPHHPTLFNGKDHVCGVAPRFDVSDGVFESGL